MAMTCARCLSNTVLNVSATLYLLIAIVIIAIAGSTFFTPYGEIMEPLYAASFLGGGIAVFLIAVVGYCAACSKEDEGSDKQGNRCSLWIFTFLTFCMLILTITAIALMFQYEAVLTLAASAGLDEEALNAEAIKYEHLYGERGTEIVQTLMTNTFEACEADVNATGVAAATTFTFACGNSYFDVFATFVNRGCFHVDADLDEPRPINGSAGSYFDHCYEGELYSAWPVNSADTVASVGLEGALNTPKGLYCACSATIIEGYVLPYLDFAKWVALTVVVFFFLVFVACVHQMCKRGCCKPAPEPEFKPASQKNSTSAPGGVQMGYGQMDAPAPQNGKKPTKKQQKYKDDFLSRP